MFAPIRLIYGLRPHASSGVLAGTLVAGTTFVATPFVIPELVERFDVSLGAAGLASTAQVGGFAAATFVAGRRMRPRRAVLLGAALVLLAANLASAAAPWFLAVVALRVLAGVGAGLMTWVAWADAAGHPRRLSDVAGIAPVGAIVSAPLIGSLAGVGGDRAVFLAMAVAGAVALLFPVRIDPASRGPRRKRISPSRSNRILLVALGLATLFGSSLYIYAAGAAQSDLDLSAGVAAAAYSLNAATGLVATRFTKRRGGAGAWLLGITASILLIALVDHPAAFFAGMALWGFSFWMAVPQVLRLLAERSFSPDERIGDAHAGMAVGRAIGPAAGAAFMAGGMFEALGVFAASGVALAAAAIFGVESFRRHGGDADVAPRVEPTEWKVGSR